MTRSQTLSRALLQYGTAFRIFAVVGALGAFIAGYYAGNAAPLTQFERDMNMGWRMSEAVWIWWGLGVGILLQGFWCGLVSDAIATLLEPKSSAQVP